MIEKIDEYGIRCDICEEYFDDDSKILCIDDDTYIHEKCSAVYIRDMHDVEDYGLKDLLTKTVDYINLKNGRY